MKKLAIIIFCVVTILVLSIEFSKSMNSTQINSFEEENIDTLSISQSQHCVNNQ